MRFDIITIFPELFDGFLECGIVRRALQSAQKYSLVANSVKSEIVIEPEIVIEE